jgi:hypothetical protein
MKIFSDLSLTRAPHRARHGWHPGWLFRNGAQGAWFDPSDLSTLFQDAAGTIAVTAAGQPVGRMADKSGGGRHATQTTLSARPIYRTDGQRHWLEFDGVDDRMVLAAPLDLNSGTVVMGLSEPLNTPVSARFALISGGVAGYITIARDTRSLAKNNSGSNRDVDTPTLFAMSAKSAVGIRVLNETIFARRWPDPTEYHNAVAASAGLQSTNTLMAFSLAGSIPARVDLHGLLLCVNALPSDTYARALSHMNARIAL